MTWTRTILKLIIKNLKTVIEELEAEVYSDPTAYVNGGEHRVTYADQEELLMDVKLVTVTPDAEKTMAHIARVSNPSNQDNEKVRWTIQILYQT